MRPVTQLKDWWQRQLSDAAMLQYSDREMCFHWEELFGLVQGGQFGDNAPGVLFVPKPVNAVTFQIGMWHRINRELGMIFSQYEEDDVPVAQLTRMAAIIAETAESPIAQRGAAIGQMDAEEFIGWLNQMSEFLLEAHQLEKGVFIWL